MRDSADGGRNVPPTAAVPVRPYRQTNLIFGQPVVGSQLRDQRTGDPVVANAKKLDGSGRAVGDSFAKVKSGHALCRAAGCPELLATAPNRVGALLVSLAELYEGPLTFTVPTAEPGCRVYVIPFIFTCRTEAVFPAV